MFLIQNGKQSPTNGSWSHTDSSKVTGVRNQKKIIFGNAVNGKCKASLDWNVKKPKGLLSTKVAFLHCSFSKLKPHLKIRFIALQPIILPISSLKESSAHPTEKSFRIACSTPSMTLMLRCSALRASHLWFYLFINLEVITATLNKQETRVKEKWQHSA